MPAHNEEAWIAGCLQSIQAASAHRGLRGEGVVTVVVADGCTDATAAIARRLGAIVVESACCNVGCARAAGAALAISEGARWLAFTDADTVVRPAWLVEQLALRADAVCGTIEVEDWGPYRDTVRHLHERQYVDADNHRHIHGANMGVSTSAYLAAGGFQPLDCHEDVMLVNALIGSGARIAWSAAPRVATSARVSLRTPEGFAATLARQHRELAGDADTSAA